MRARESATDELLPPEAEDRLRLRAFRVFYDKAFADEPDLTIRFAKSIIASAAPIRDAAAAVEWQERHGRRRDRSDR